MKKKIMETIKAVGLVIDDFIIGSGARDGFSEIHYRPYHYRPNRDPRKEYSTTLVTGTVKETLQYYENITHGSLRTKLYIRFTKILRMDH